MTTRPSNIGRAAGTEVPQLYLHFPPSAGEPPWSLKGFSTIDLSAGQSRSVSFPLSHRVLANFNSRTGTWGVTPGVYTVAVGSSSADLRSEAALAIPR